MTKVVAESYVNMHSWLSELSRRAPWISFNVRVYLNWVVW